MIDGGEPGPWPLVSSSFGQFDIAGFAKSASYWYRSLWLAAVAADDAGRPPLPELHVVRVSQTWDTPPAPPPVWPVSAACNITEFQDMCSPRGSDTPFDACLACVRAHNHTMEKIACDGPSVWATLCQTGGVQPSANAIDLQVFSDLDAVELLLDGRSHGTAPCSAGGFASFGAVPHGATNLTALGRKGGAAGEVLARHTQLKAKVAAAVLLSLDAPSALTGTGSTLLLDGHDAALVRATVVDADGAVVAAGAGASVVVSFAVASGPGRVAGVHNGDAKCHEPQAAASRSAYHGLARAVVKVTVDAASASAAELQLLATEVDGVAGAAVGSTGERVTILRRGAATASSIVVTATAPGLASGSISIPVSTDAAAHSVLAVAAASVRQPLTFE